jgi:Nif-specific regulatory protein
MPSLAERRGDIRELAGSFCAETCRSDGLAPRELSRDALRALEAAEWPGNVRQLAARVERGVLNANSEGLLQVERRHLFPDSPAKPEPPDATTYQDAMSRFQEQFLRKALAESGWNVAETARKLDMARAYLYELIKAHGIERERG